MESAAEQKFETNIPLRSGESTIGPLDLMLQLIDSYEVDIFDVKLSVVTSDFIHAMQHLVLTLEEKSSFSNLASRLLYYKSRLLLPDQDIDEDEELDRLPRDLVDQLLEYKSLQQAAKLLRNLEREESETFFRNAGWNHLPVDVPETLDADLISLLRTFQDFLIKQEHKKPFEINPEEVDSAILEKKLIVALKNSQTLDLFDFLKDGSRMYCIVAFLLILELAKINVIKIAQTSQWESITIIVIPEGLASYEQNAIAN
jgi:segregation and condensation protein A